MSLLTRHFWDDGVNPKDAAPVQLLSHPKTLSSLEECFALAPSIHLSAFGLAQLHIGYCVASFFSRQLLFL